MYFRKKYNLFKLNLFLIQSLVIGMHLIASITYYNVEIISINNYQNLTRRIGFWFQNNRAILSRFIIGIIIVYCNVTCTVIMTYVLSHERPCKNQCLRTLLFSHIVLSHYFLRTELSILLTIWLNYYNLSERRFDRYYNFISNNIHVVFAFTRPYFVIWLLYVNLN